MTDNLSLFAVSALDGRYNEKVQELAPIVSEAGLIRYRIIVEAKWLLFLSNHNQISNDLKLSDEQKALLESISSKPSREAYQAVKDHEAITNHDVKAVEYYLRDTLKSSGFSDKAMAFIHFACTSEDINNLSYALMLQDIRENVLLKQMATMIERLQKLSEENMGLAMLSRTHGQTASPSTLGKELAVFCHRLFKVYNQIRSVKIEGKINGAVGNYNAHVSAYPDLDWLKLSKDFIQNELGLHWNPLTTQIENHDSMCEFFDYLRKFHTISIGLCRDMWGYISLGYFGQKLKKGEVGSSTMPHKVNPIDFENAEGNFGVSSSLCVHFSEKLPISRWQRDLSDSTVQRVIGTACGHSLIALKSLDKGLSKLKVREDIIKKDLDEAPEVLAEAIQTVMRRYGVMDAYERLKEATRGQSVSLESLQKVVNDCDELPGDAKKDLLKLTPASYVGLASQVGKVGLSEIRF